MPMPNGTKGLAIPAGTPAGSLSELTLPVLRGIFSTGITPAGNFTMRWKNNRLLAGNL